jgi:hypothetical protein
MPKNSGWNVQCLAGHCFEVPEGSPLVEKCEKRAKLGFLDAYIIPRDQCPECIQQDIDQALSFLKTCSMVGCVYFNEKHDCSKCAVGALREAEARLKNAPLLLRPEVVIW